MSISNYEKFKGSKISLEPFFNNKRIYSATDKEAIKQSKRNEIGLSGFINVEQGVVGLYHDTLEIFDLMGKETEAGVAWKDSPVGIAAFVVVSVLGAVTATLDFIRQSGSIENDLQRNKVGGGKV